MAVACENWFLRLRGEHKLSVSENGVLIYEGGSDWSLEKKLDNEELHNFERFTRFY